MLSFKKYWEDLKKESLALKKLEEENRQLREQKRLKDLSEWRAKEEWREKTKPKSIILSHDGESTEPRKSDLTGILRFFGIAIPVGLGTGFIIFQTLETKPNSHLQSIDGSSAASVTATDSGKIEGNIFVVTRGGESIALGDVEVTLRQNFSSFVSTRTNAAGLFSLEAPSGFYVLEVNAKRFTGSSTEDYSWIHQVRILSGQTQKIQLSNSNMTSNY